MSHFFVYFCSFYVLFLCIFYVLPIGVINDDDNDNAMQDVRFFQHRHIMCLKLQSQFSI